MYETRQPITSDNFHAARASQAGRVIVEAPYSPVRIRNVREEMAQTMQENPQITEAELLEFFTPEQVTAHAPEARREANRRSVRYVA